jgi:hypothetical protein
MLLRSLLTCLLLTALVACAPASVPTLASTPTMDLPTVPQSSPTLDVTGTSSPTPEIASPTPPPVEPTTISTPEPPPTEATAAILPTLLPPTAQATSIPQPGAGSAAIQFYSPGPLSRVTSPVKFYGYAVPGYDSKGTVELFGEDGTRMATELLQLNTDVKWAYFNWSLPFNARGAGELGRLTLSTRDPYGRLTAVQSVHLILLPDGLEIINPPGDLTERCIIKSPAAGVFISGGTVSVSGVMRPYNTLPLTVELVARDGSIPGSQLVSLPPGSDGLYVPFNVDIPYSISSYTPVLLTVRQSDDRIGGTMYLYSQELLLNP